MKTKKSNVQYLSIVSVSVLAALLAGCGTTSGIKPAGRDAVILNKYNAVVVKDFADKVTPEAVGASTSNQESRDRMRTATRTFADAIAAEIRKTGLFKDVVREGTPAAPTLLISGDITRYEKGDLTLRFLVGMGAGSSYLDAKVELKDAQTGELLGTVTVDKNSWVLGGGLAATQTPEALMEEAAKRIAQEIKKIRSGTAARKA